MNNIVTTDVFNTDICSVSHDNRKKRDDKNAKK